tara:strand:- start:155 stop:739 length:585 start_codon:yes stop_codon:yes gene_type:complete
MHKLLNYKGEFYRKLIHISSSIIPLSILYFSKEYILPYIILISILLPTLDYLRIDNNIIQKYYNILFNIVTRPSETRKLTGGSWVFIGSALTLILFPENIAIVSLLVMSLSDSAAALVGIKYGKTNLFNKTLEGSMAFFITTLIIIHLLIEIPIYLTIICSLIITFVELLSFKKINDNLSIPLVTALMLYIFIR